MVAYCCILVRVCAENTRVLGYGVISRHPGDHSVCWIVPSIHFKDFVLHPLDFPPLKKNLSEVKLKYAVFCVTVPTGSRGAIVVVVVIPLSVISAGL